MAKRKRRSVAERKRNLVLGLLVLALMLAIALVSVPRMPRSGNTELTDREEEGSAGVDRQGGETAEEPGTESNGASSREGDAQRSGRREMQSPLVAASRPPSGAGRIAVVIDDVGNSLADLEPFLDFPGALTIAVLPALTHSRKAALRAADAGKEVIVHMPMAAENGTYPGPGTITPGQDPHQLVALLAENLSTVPGAVGVNNHMGSLTTSNSEAMGIVLAYMKARGLFFLDSRTTRESVVPQVAAGIGTPWLERDVFLDNEPTREYVTAALEEGAQIARSEGTAILIGHAANEVVAEVLSANYERLREIGYRFVTLRELSTPVVAGTEEPIDAADR